MTSGEIRRRSALFRPASKAEKQYKKVLRPVFPRNDGRKRRAPRNADAGRFALFRPGAATPQRAGAALPCGKAAPDHVAVIEVYSRPILRAMLWAARRPAPMARMTVAAPVTMSPPAYTLGMEVSPFSSTAM